MKTSNKISFSRRSFLQTSALASGGMLVGFNLFTACKEDVKPPVDLSLLDYNDFNAFIKISDEGKVTIFAPNPEIGQGVKTSMPMLIAEELDVAWEDVHVVQGKLDTKNYTRQVAGGSQSLRQGWTPLRQTGATARQMLVNAAAAKWGVSASECKTNKGVITNANGDKLGYGEVVKEAASLEVPENVTLKDVKDFYIIGQDISNVDIDEIVTGKPLFGLDYKQEGMQYASVLRPPAFGQKLESFDDTNSRAVNGVNDVIKFGDKIAVLASSTWAAMKGKKALKATWTQDSKAESTAFHDETLLGLLNGDKFDTRRKDGDVKKAFAEADQVLERTYETPFVPHNCMEPMNFFANVTTDKIELVGPIQTPAGTAGQVARMLGRDASEVTLEMTRMGGGFGRRLYGDFALEAAEVSHLAKKPVKVIFSREDDMAAGIYRPAIKYRIAASIKDGKLTGYHLKEAAINGNMYGLIPNFFPAGAIENYQVDTANYKSNITTGAWRAPYTNVLASCEQSFFDEIAEAMGVDRIKLHMDLLDKVKGTTDERIQYSPERLQGVIKKVVKESNYGKEKDVYQGFAVYYCHNTHVAEVADIIMDNGVPVVKKVTVAVDCGIVVNPLGAKNQVVGGVIDGIGHSMYGEITFNDGAPQSNNYDSYQLIRMLQTPQVDVHFIENDIAPTGLGEPTLPPVGGAVANAIYKATGKRLTKMPYMNNMDVEPVVG
ncbi:molybdopterin-dependent oxidoreductase [Flavobacteriaceae bacterium S0825]|uniref:xanthine dehydrogenase family protein molybdopterin-binding subunit n=1 Tax=Gaetbulibacter sp. S0825 TaxID=2720084 RepID=UPI0014302941|nr:molybdopterin cofactor-binding domain-containing protein [Gaetbulibacter sp. S0825]MCK0108384.1 molybdopterin-dependent oxidoreductase [Flavobacteriaceae bacterium S0825]NIX64020.1 xanthine dehydrogenase family protein molybdopterin-binding subunit [Gaetbulibacter sp. S0825]